MAVTISPRTATASSPPETTRLIVLALLTACIYRSRHSNRAGHTRAQPHERTVPDLAEIGEVSARAVSILGIERHIQDASANAPPHRGSGSHRAFCNDGAVSDLVVAGLSHLNL